MKPDALSRAQAVQRAAARDGFDWPAGDRRLWRKLAEEVAELRAVAHDRARAADELGDLLFMAVNVARHLRVNAAAALAGAIRKFERRYAHVARHAAGLPPRDDARRLARMEALWQEAKRRERPKGRGKVGRIATGKKSERPLRGRGGSRHAHRDRR